MTLLETIRTTPVSVIYSDTAIQDATVDTDKRTFILTSLLPWNEYTFKIRAKNIKRRLDLGVLLKGGNRKRN
jgi:hypothetical protein